MKWIVCFLVVIGLSTPVSAFSAPLISQLVDFPESEQVNASQEQHPEFRVPLGMLKTQVRRFTFEKDVRVAGTTHSRTMRVPEQYEVDEVFDHFKMQLRKQNAETLYECQSRECGQSNEWANQYFKQNVLYGPDRYQRLMVTEIMKDEQRHFVMVYVIRRGNQRLYYHLLSIQPEKMLSGLASLDIEAITAKFQQDGYVVLPGVKFNDDARITKVSDNAYETLASLMKESDALKLIVVGHADRDSLPAAKAQSTFNAKEIANEFRRRFPDLKSRIDYEGIGYLAPRPGLEQITRIEVVEAR